jgi:predicted TIM-barrel fold metal-dependent hydrolase
MDRFQPSERIEQIRKRLDCPVIDSDGHLTEFRPVLMEYIAKAGGSNMPNRFIQARQGTFLDPAWYGLADAERMARWTHRPPFWGESLADHGVDVATAMFPDLLYRRLDELGIDFAVLYPTSGINAQGYLDAETRRAVCRGFNDYYADHWMGHPDRMTPAAIIPMFTPEEAIAELEYTVGKRGFKTVMLASYVRRPVSRFADKYPEAGRFAWRIDTYGIDSEHDYDPVWARCRELGVVASFHTPGEGSTFHNSISNTVYNHVGHFASAATAICKSLFLGGVSQRFPDLNFLFLEGGVGWARSLLADLTGHWEKRNLRALAQLSDPRLVDVDLFMDLYRRFGGSLYREDIPRATIAERWKVNAEDPTDSFARLNIADKHELRRLFTNNFHFGCEGDDPIMPSAFLARYNPGRVRFKAVFGSDIGHWDVPRMAEVLEEVYEPIEKEVIDPADLREFIFGNPVRLWTAGNAEFFKGTAVEQAAARLLGAGRSAAQGAQPAEQ